MKISLSKISIIAMAAVLSVKFGLLDANAVGQEAEGEVTETSQDADAVTAAETEAAAKPRDVLPEMLAVIATEREALEAKRLDLAAREADLLLVQASVDRQMTDLETLHAELSRLLETANMKHGEDLERLVNIYRAMKPVQAGQIMSTMDLEVSTLVIATMKENVSGPILANMSPERAQTISKIIYERSKLPGDQREIAIPSGG